MAGLRNHWGGDFLVELSDEAIDVFCSAHAKAPSPFTQDLDRSRRRPDRADTRGRDDDRTATGTMEHAPADPCKTWQSGVALAGGEVTDRRATPGGEQHRSAIRGVPSSAAPTSSAEGPADRTTLAARCRLMTVARAARGADERV